MSRFSKHLGKLLLKGGKAALVEEHEWSAGEEPTSKAFAELKNAKKNRHPHLLLYDTTRVVLTGEQDYIHASYVDGHRTASEYILAQAPIEELEEDFWRMIWHVKSQLIVVLTRTKHPTNQLKMCSDFWPTSSQDEKVLENGNLRVKMTSMTQDIGMDTYDMLLTNWKQPKIQLKIRLMHLTSWVEDNDIPEDLPRFISRLRVNQCLQDKVNAHKHQSPVTIVCSTGVIRSGTLVAADICLRQLNKEKRVNVLDTVRLIRKQRYGCVENFQHYVFLLRLVSNYIIQIGTVDNVPLNLPGIDQKFK